MQLQETISSIRLTIIFAETQPVRSRICKVISLPWHRSLFEIKLKSRDNVRLCGLTISYRQIQRVRMICFGVFNIRNDEIGWRHSSLVSFHLLRRSPVSILTTTSTRASFTSKLSTFAQISRVYS